MRKAIERSKNLRHAIAWMSSLAALPIAIISVVEGATPMQIALWLSVIVTVQLTRLLPEAFEAKEVYNDDIEEV